MSSEKVDLGMHNSMPEHKLFHDVTYHCAFLKESIVCNLKLIYFEVRSDKIMRVLQIRNIFQNYTVLLHVCYKQTCLLSVKYGTPEGTFLF